MIAVRLAFRNLLGAGLRTWLNVAVLSFAFVVIVFYNGMLDGWNMQAQRDTRAWETGSGQFWHPSYDRYDPFSFQDAHAKVEGKALELVIKNEITPILVTQASIYPSGRMQNIILKGIDPGQKILSIPSYLLKTTGSGIPAIIGKRMASETRIKKGDHLLVRWRDKNGTFDATELFIISVFNSNVPGIDMGQVWIPLDSLRDMTGMKGEATYLVGGENLSSVRPGGWVFKSPEFLMQDLKQVMQQKKGSSRIIYGLLLAIALLAIFDTQVLSIFRRQKEIGTYIALGMTRSQVVKIFTVEGSAHSILALILGSLYGIPLLLAIKSTGIPMPKTAGDMGLSISDSIIPFYSAGMIVSTVLLVVISATIVSYFPARKISKMNPTEALKGKIQ